MEAVLDAMYVQRKENRRQEKERKERADAAEAVLADAARLVNKIQDFSARPTEGKAGEGQILADMKRCAECAGIGAQQVRKEMQQTNKCVSQHMEPAWAKLGDGFCFAGGQEEEEPHQLHRVRIPGNVASGKEACETDPQCAGIHYDTRTSDYVLLAKLGVPNKQDTGFRTCYTLRRDPVGRGSGVRIDLERLIQLKQFLVAENVKLTAKTEKLRAEKKYFERAVELLRTLRYSNIKASGSFGYDETTAAVGGWETVMTTTDEWETQETTTQTPDSIHDTLHELGYRDELEV